MPCLMFVSPGCLSQRSRASVYIGHANFGVSRMTALIYVKRLNAKRLLSA